MDFNVEDRKEDFDNRDRKDDTDRYSAFDDKVASLFQPDTTLTGQYFDSLRRKTELYPEKQLVLAVLEDGITCFQDNLGATHGKNKQLFRETEEWIFGDNPDWLFSFENICAILGLNPDYLRKGLLRWKTAKLREQEKDQASEPKKLAS
jgi:hypothetical protein